MKNVFKNVSEANRLKALKYVKAGTSVAYSIFRYVLLISVGFIILYPLLYMIVTSIMSPTAFNNSTRVWIPTELSIAKNYEMANEALDYFPGLLNTLKYEVVSALIQVVSCAIVGYGFARFNFKGKKIFTAILFLTILVPDMVVLIPRVRNYSNLDFLGIFGGIENIIIWFSENILGKVSTVDLTPKIFDTGWSMWLPSIFGVGLRSGVLIYIYIQFFSGLPRELEEAAWVDGAGPLKTFVRIAVPSSSVVFITVLVFSLIWHWNDSLLSSMYFSDNQPLASAITSIEPYMIMKWGLYFNSSFPQAASIIMASCIMFISPMLIFYMFVQRGFIESIDRVGITG